MVEFQGYGINKYSQGTARVDTGVPTNKSITDTVNSHVEARVYLDARDNTEYGMLRTFARLNWVRSSGSDDNSGSQPRRGQMFAGSGGNYSNLQTGFYAAEAFVQLGGFLVGRTTSFANVGNPSLLFTTQNSSPGRVNEIAYTLSVGNGVSISAAVEDAAELRNGVFVSSGVLQNVTVNGTAYTNGGIANAGGFAGASSLVVTSPQNQMPDGVLSVDVAQAWGTGKLAGVIHQVYVPKFISYAAQGWGAGGNSFANDNSTSALTGWAVQGQTKINLPMIPAGDYVNIYAAYAIGASGRTIGSVATDTANSITPSATASGGNASFGMCNAAWGGYDAVGDLASNTVKLSTSYSFGGEFKHYFTPTVAAYVGGTYGAIRYGFGHRMSSVVFAAAPHDADMWGVALGAIWSPVSGLEINPELAYRKADIKADNGVINGTKYGVKSDDQYIGRIRVARSF